MSKAIHVTARLPEAVAAELDRKAAALGITRSEACRRAIKFGLMLIEPNHSIDISRLVTAIEFCQTALDGILARDYPDFADKIYDVVLRRMEDHHA